MRDLMDKKHHDANQQPGRDREIYPERQTPLDGHRPGIIEGLCDWPDYAREIRLTFASMHGPPVAGMQIERAGSVEVAGKFGGEELFTAEDAEARRGRPKTEFVLIPLRAPRLSA
jgi:hypothetical protein